MAEYNFYVYSSTGSDILIEDLGILVEAGEANKRCLCEVITDKEILESGDLWTLIEAGDIIPNDGVADMTPEEATTYVKIADEHFHTIVSLTDFDIPSPYDDDYFYYDEAYGKYKTRNFQEEVTKNQDVVDSKTHSELVSGNPHDVTKGDVGLGNVPNVDTTSAVTNDHTHSNKTELDLVSDGDHDVRNDNPHTVTKSQIGLGSVPNLDTTSAVTNDHTHSNKTELDLVSDGDHDVRNDNPHSVTKTQVGLGSVPNLDTTNAVGNEHTHSNKTELDLVSDGDHDVRNDNPHTVTKSQVGLSNVTNVAQIPLSQKGIAGGVAELDGGGKVPVSQLPASVTGAVEYQGTWNANTNSPTLSSSGGGGTKGDYYVVSVAGTTTIDGEDDWQVNDWIIHNGSIWEKVDNTDSGGGSSIFGSDFDKVSSEIISSTTSSYYQEKLEFNTPILTSGNTYRVSWSFEGKNSNTSGKFNARIQLNNDTELNSYTMEPKDINNWIPFSGFYYITGMSGSQEIDIDFSNTGNGTAYIRRVRIEFWRVS